MLRLPRVAFAVVPPTAQDTGQGQAGPEGFRPMSAKSLLELATYTTACQQGRSYLPVQGITELSNTHQECYQACPQLRDFLESLWS